MRLFPKREGHLLDSVQRLHMLTWLGVFLVAGFLYGPWLWLVGGLFLVVVTIARWVGGSAAGTIYQPSGASVASRTAYSAPESLAVRGRFEEAIAAYQAAAAGEPDDPEPWLRIARIERFDLKRPERALEALRAARTRTSDDSATALLIAREIADVLLRDSGDPRRAMPELARLASAHPDTPPGRWAAHELADLKKTLR